MLFRLLLVCALIVVLIYLIQQFKRQPSGRQKILKWQLLLGLIALMLIVLAATGRIHWIGAAFATLLAFFRQIIPVLLRWSPAIKQIYQQYQHHKHQQQNHQHHHQQQHRHQQQANQQQQNQPPGKNTGNMQRKDALQILGLDETATRDDIIKAHRKLMQKVHPDRGGSAELAAQVNRAKDILLG